ncbi:hypothetical protein BT96DRAFT_938973 [Gymnopus androsaceus JB14]|uniref:Chromo domain-containing protein n=1 Tax=Gymnopus androsaceus JB14 TaxID=1447944 RepID=A0A6A4HTR5_9AGAR|nr:hypothetical protein BT96DRAFT_938973 [Gymnopus androsaceus JB14]
MSSIVAKVDVQHKFFMRVLLEYIIKNLAEGQNHYAHMKLMEAENKRLRTKVLLKKTKRVAVNSGTSHHLTGEENMRVLFKGELKGVLQQLKLKVAAIRKELQAAEKAEEEERKAEDARQKKAHASDRETETESDSNAPFNDAIPSSSFIPSLPTRPRPWARLIQKALPDPNAQPTDPAILSEEQSDESDEERGGNNTLPEIRDQSEVSEGSEEASDGSDNSDSDEEEELKIRRIIGHKCTGKELCFQVEWEDDDETWEPLSNVENCIAVDIYLAHHQLTEPLQLSKQQYSMKNL